MPRPGQPFRELTNWTLDADKAVVLTLGDAHSAIGFRLCGPLGWHPPPCGVTLPALAKSTGQPGASFSECFGTVPDSSPHPHIVPIFLIEVPARVVPGA